MITLHVERVKAAKLARINLGKPTFEKIGKAVEQGVLDNISKQQQADGGALKRNALSTQLRKARQGRPQESLKDEKHRFIQKRGRSWATTATDTSAVVEPANSELKDLNRYVQGMGYVGWFDFSRLAVKAIRLIVRKRLKEIIRKAAR